MIIDLIRNDSRRILSYAACLWVMAFPLLAVALGEDSSIKNIDNGGSFFPIEGGQPIYHVQEPVTPFDQPAKPLNMSTTLWKAESLTENDWNQADERIDPELFISAEPLENHFRSLLEGPSRPQVEQKGGAHVRVYHPAPSGVKKADNQNLEGASAALIPVIEDANEIALNPPQHIVQQAPAQTLAAPKSVGLVVEKPLKNTAVTSNMQNEDIIAQATASATEPQNPILINFNNVGMTEYLHFVSRLTNKNFVYDENDLLFNVTIVSEEPVTIQEIMVALLQVLRIHDLSVIEDGDNFIIHRNPAVKSLSNVVIDNYGTPVEIPPDAEIITQVIQLNTLDALNAQNVVSNLMSARGIVEVFRDTNHLVISDFAVNVKQIVQVLKGVDAPASSLTVGQYIVRNTSLDTLVEIAQSILKPLAKEQPLIFIPNASSNSIFIMTTPFLMERVLPILQRIDQRDGTTGVFDLKNVQFMNYDAWRSSLHGEEFAPGGAGAGAGRPGGAAGAGEVEGLRGRWELDNRGHWFFRPALPDTMPGSTGNPFVPGLRGTIGIPGVEPVPAQYTLRGLRALTQQPGINMGLPGATGFDGRPGAAGAAASQKAFVTGVGAMPGTPTGETFGPTSAALSGSLGTGAEGTGTGTAGFGPTGPVSVPPPEGYWRIDPQGNWFFQPGKRPPYQPGQGPTEEELRGPQGRWVIDDQGLWIFELAPDESIYSGQKTRYGKLNPALPVGFVERTKFFIYKLQFRKGDAVEEAVKRIGLSLVDSEAVNAGFLATLNSVQWMEESNSLVMSGPPEELNKVIELINEIDRPLRQVFIEMLILQTTIEDSLNYGVNWATRFGGGNTSGSEGFIAGASQLPRALNTTGLVAGPDGTIVPAVPNGTQFVNSPGFTLGIIGQHIVHKCFGLEFNSIGALVTALHERNVGNVVLNPKLLTEDGVPAEVFVGINTQFRTQSLSNDTGQVLTSNFEFRDIGTRLTVTPTLGPGNIITLEISEESSSVIQNPASNNNGGGGSGSALLSDSGAGPTTRKNTTKTKIHVPDGFFIIISGMIQDDDSQLRNQVPCLGGAPLIGSLFSYKRLTCSKNNLMLFIRPKLIDTDEEINNLTRHQQDIFKVKARKKAMWKHEVEEAIDFMNVQDYVECGKTDVFQFEADAEAGRLTGTTPQGPMNARRAPPRAPKPPPPARAVRSCTRRCR